jgi:hypothetical protein
MRREGSWEKLIVFVVSEANEHRIWHHAFALIAPHVLVERVHELGSIYRYGLPDLLIVYGNSREWERQLRKSDRELPPTIFLTTTSKPGISGITEVFSNGLKSRDLVSLVVEALQE